MGEDEVCKGGGEGGKKKHVKEGKGGRRSGKEGVSSRETKRRRVGKMRERGRKLLRVKKKKECWLQNLIILILEF